MDEMRKRIASLTGVILLGMVLGYLGGFIQYRNESRHGSQYSNWEHEWLMIPALPGILVSSILGQHDYQLTEHWIQHRHSMAAWNGLVFAVLAAAPVLLIKRTRTHLPVQTERHGSG